MRVNLGKRDLLIVCVLHHLCTTFDIYCRLFILSDHLSDCNSTDKSNLMGSFLVSSPLISASSAL